MLHKYDGLITDSDKRALSIDLRTPPTYEAFQAKLKYGKGGHTGGMIGLTYNMMAEWSEPITKIVYDGLCKMQQENHTPDWFKGRWLVPMPKVLNPTEKDLRPLMMVEVLRKAWYSFSIKKMWTFLESHKLIQKNQFAYRKDREGPIAQLITSSILDEAAETESSIVTSSWDEVHGFDNVTTNSSKLSMYAKGLPIGFVNHLADLDKNGHVYVRTPLAHYTWATELATNPDLTIAEIRNKNSELIKVLCNKGIAQGDLDSCLRYIIFLKISL